MSRAFWLKTTWISALAVLSFPLGFLSLEAGTHMDGPGSLVSDWLGRYLYSGGVGLLGAAPRNGDHRFSYVIGSMIVTDAAVFFVIALLAVSLFSRLVRFRNQ